MIEQPISPMLAKAAKEVPEGDYVYEPKWDGFRCIIVRDGDDVTLASRGKKPLTRYFPEVVKAARTLPDGCIVDGELILPVGEPGAQQLSWEDLSARIHPAESRVTMLARETPAQFVAFDLLQVGGEDLTELPFRERRRRLEQLFEAPHDDALHITRTTDSAEAARDWFTRWEGAGLDGVVAKPADGPYRQGKRDLVKIKHKRTAEAVVVGYRVAKGGSGVGSLLLGMFDGGTLVRVGGVVSLPAKRRLELVDELRELEIDEPDEALRKGPNRWGGDDEWVALKPERVVEVEFDQLEGNRFRHAVTLLRWRPDRDPQSCKLDQVDRAVAYDLAEVLSSGD